MKINRYLVFAYPAYYPSGGWGDFYESYDQLVDATVKADTLLRLQDNVEIVDSETGEDIYIYPRHRSHME